MNNKILIIKPIMFKQLKAIVCLGNAVLKSVQVFLNGIINL